MALTWKTTPATSDDWPAEHLRPRGASPRRGAWISQTAAGRRWLTALALPVLLSLLASCAEQSKEKNAGIDAQGALDLKQERSAASSVSPPVASPLTHAIRDINHAATQRFLSAMSTAFVSDPSMKALSLRSAAIERRATALADPIRPELTASAKTFEDGGTLTANQPLFDFGKRRARIAQVRADGMQEAQALAREQQSLLRDGLGAVLDVWFLSQVIGLRTRQIADFHEALTTATRLADLNLITAADLRYAEVELQRAEIDKRQAQDDVAAARRVWHNIVGQDALPSSVHFGALRRAAGIETLPKAQALSAKRNLDIRELDVREHQLAARISVLERQNTPTINATIEGDFTGSETDLNSGLSVTFPIFRRDTRDDAAQERSDLNALAAERASVQSDTAFELRQRMSRIADLRGLVGAQRDSVELLRQRVEDLSLQLDTGLASYDDFLSAQVDVYDAELEILDNLNEINQSQAEIILLSGALIP